MNKDNTFKTRLDDHEQSKRIRELLTKRILEACNKMPIAQLHMIASIIEESLET